MNKFKALFKDSYGWDVLSKYLVMLGLVLIPGKYTIVFGLILIVLGCLRSYSKNKSKRYKELLVFENHLIKIKNKLNFYRNTLKHNKNFKILTCPNCSQKLRVPRKKGKITITCKKCGKKFEGRS